MGRPWPTGGLSRQKTNKWYKMVQPTKMTHYIQEFPVSSVGQITSYTETFLAFRQSLQSNVRIVLTIRPRLLCSSFSPVLSQKFMAFAAVYLRSSLSCDVAQSKLLVRCRRFGPIFKGHDVQRLGLPVYSAVRCSTAKTSSLFANYATFRR